MLLQYVLVSLLYKCNILELFGPYFVATNSGSLDRKVPAILPMASEVLPASNKLALSTRLDRFSGSSLQVWGAVGSWPTVCCRTVVGAEWACVSVTGCCTLRGRTSVGRRVALGKYAQCQSEPMMQMRLTLPLPVPAHHGIYMGGEGGVVIKYGFRLKMVPPKAGLERNPD